MKGNTATEGTDFIISQGTGVDYFQLLTFRNNFTAKYQFYWRV